MKTCSTCGSTPIIAKNMCESCYRKILRKADPEKFRKYSSKWRKANPEKTKLSYTKTNRKHGHKPISENTSCSFFLGVHVAEQVLAKVFKNIKVMPPNNPGYDFICNKKMKIDVKSACTSKRNNWNFTINKNTTADYFLCIAFNNRKSLTPLYLWLIPGNNINHLSGTSIAKSTKHRWNEYELDISKTLECCNKMKYSPIPKRSQKV